MHSQKKDCPERENTLVQSGKFWQMRNISIGNEYKNILCP